MGIWVISSLGAIMNSAAMIMIAQIVCVHMYVFSVELLSHKLGIFSTLVDTTK